MIKTLMLIGIFSGTTINSTGCHVIEEELFHFVEIEDLLEDDEDDIIACEPFEEEFCECKPEEIYDKTRKYQGV